jgi:hypothetical protein
MFCENIKGKQMPCSDGSYKQKCYIALIIVVWLIPFFHVGWKGGSWNVFPRWWGFQHDAAAVGRAPNVVMAKVEVDGSGAARLGDSSGALSQTLPTIPIRRQRIGNLTCGQGPETAISWALIMIVRMCRK